jgi:hypothetical protein
MVHMINVLTVADKMLPLQASSSRRIGRSC